MIYFVIYFGFQSDAAILHKLEDMMVSARWKAIKMIAPPPEECD